MRERGQTQKGMSYDSIYIKSRKCKQMVKKLKARHCLPGIGVEGRTWGNLFLVFSCLNFMVGFFFFLIISTFNYYLFIFLAVLGPRLRARASSSHGKRGPLLIAVRGPLTIAASLVAEHRLQTRRLSSCGPQAQPLRGMRDPPRPGPEPVSPTLAGRLPTTTPPGKSQWFLICRNFNF